MKRGEVKGGRVGAKTLPAARGYMRILLFLSIITALLAPAANGEMQRRINVGPDFSYYLLDSDYFGMEDAFGLGLAFRYEVYNNIYIENIIGRFTSNDGVVDIDGLNYHLDLLAILPVLIPYRPLLRAGVGFISVNPITSTPIETYRPAQTAFYVLCGGGFTRTIRENIIIETSADLYVTPYDYRIYQFDRSSVSMDDVRFTHVIVNLGVSYSF
jgi:hypothetical protein